MGRQMSLSLILAVLAVLGAAAAAANGEARLFLHFIDSRLANSQKKRYFVIINQYGASNKAGWTC